jgi:microcystin-dependent protein
MATPYLSQITLFAFSFPPRGWAACNGQILAIGQNQALFSLLGTTYGGNGQTNFALPNLQGRVPMHRGQVPLGAAVGSEAVTLTSAMLPAHSHGLRADNALANASAPGLALPAARPRGGIPMFAAPGGPATTLHPSSIGNTGGNQPHPNMQPYLTLNYCIALQGIFPPRN